MPLSRIGLSQNQQVTGNVTFSGTGGRIRGDYSNATVVNRMAFQSSVTNGSTIITMLPNGTSTSSTVNFEGTNDGTNCSVFQVGQTATVAQLNAAIRGTGTYLPLTMATGGAERLRIDTSGNVGIGTSSPPNKFTVWDGGTLPSAISNIQAIIGRTDGFANAGLAILANASNDSRLMFGSNSSPTLGGIEYGNTTNAMRFSTNSTERMRINSSGNVGIGLSDPSFRLDVARGSSGVVLNLQGTDAYDAETGITLSTGRAKISGFLNSGGAIPGTSLRFYTMPDSGSVTERMRIASDGYVFIGRTSDTDVAGLTLGNDGFIRANRDSTAVMVINRNVNDGDIVVFRQAGTTEGSISVSGTTVSYNGGHLARWSQLSDGSKDDTLLKGTVMSNLDDMCVWEKDGVVAENEQLNKMKVSDVEGDTNVAGVFVNWTIDEDYGVDDMNVAMTGDMIIRIAEGVTVQRGDLLMSAGDGTAKPQGDDIVRSKTIAKVTSNYVTCTYADGSYCVPCVLMAC
jgi:hypothetical protein